MSDVGLGYIHLGQQATTLSGGEAQRVKLSQRTVASAPPAARSTSSMSRPPGCTSRISRSCWRCCTELVDQGNTVVVIEHNLDVIKTADWIIDLGPEGGDAGGEVVAKGTPEEIAARAGELHRAVSEAGAEAPRAARRGARPRRAAE